MPDLETPDEDAAEQQQMVDDPDAVTPPSEAPLEVDEGDLAESTLTVPLDDDDWR